MATMNNPGPHIPDVAVAPLPASMLDGLQTSTNQGQASGDGSSSQPQFPFPDAKERLARYDVNDKLWAGKHIDAFTNLAKNPRSMSTVTQLTWISANYAGLISKVCADMLFGEPISVKLAEDDAEEMGVDASTSEDAEDTRQDWIEDFIHQNHFLTQLYESALSNSRHGDAVFKLRIGPMHANDTESTVIVEELNPAIYFPVFDPNNIRLKLSDRLAWICKGTDGNNYLRIELHTPGQIENQAYRLEGNLIKEKVDIAIFGQEGLQEFEDTEIDRSLIVHVPNWRDATRFFGYDDYSDVISLMFAYDNRLTKMDSTLDKHSDPILTVPEGVLDEKGQVRREALQMFEIPNTPTGSPSKPEYVTWDAKLEAAYAELEKLQEMLFLFTEVSPHVFGNGEGEVSGRALRLKLMRTVAKINRKRLYYDHAIKEIILVAQKLAQAHGVGVGEDYANKFVGDPERPEIEWQDGLPIDSYEAAQEEALRLESGTTTQKAAIQRLDGVDEEAAEKIVEEIKEEETMPIPSTAPKATFASGAKPVEPIPIEPSPIATVTPPPAAGR